MYSLIAILILNITTLATSRIGGELFWHIDIITLLTIIVVQALYIYRLTPKKPYIHLLAFIILVISIWDILDYLASIAMGWK